MLVLISSFGNRLLAPPTCAMSAAEAERFIKEVWGLQGAAYLVVGLRYYSRGATLGWRKFAWDDALMAVATVGSTPKSKRN